MRVAIISDIHNNEVNLKKILDYCGREKIGTIICCGDLASKESLDFLCDNFSGTVHYTFGNMDNEQLTNEICHPALDAGSKKLDSGSESGMTCKYKNIRVYHNFGEAEIDNKKIAFVHYPHIAKKLCATGKYDFVFHGHTHKPWEEMLGNCKMLNPGNVTGDFYPPTFAVWETKDDNFELVRIHSLK